MKSIHIAAEIERQERRLREGRGSPVLIAMLSEVFRELKAQEIDRAWKIYDRQQGWRR